MKSDIFQHELSETSSIFGRKHDIKTVFHGDEAATDGNTVVLPALTYDADVSDEAAAVMRGYVDHEAGHIRHTDFEAGKKMHEECLASGNQLLPQLVNALEDVRLERLVIDEYGGAEKNLRATSAAVNNEFLENIKPGNARVKNPVFIGPVALTWEGRLPYGDETNAACLHLLDPDLRRKLPDWIAKLEGCGGTKDVIELAREIEKELRDSKPKPSEGTDANPSPGESSETGARPPEGGRSGGGSQDQKLEDGGGTKSESGGDSADPGSDEGQETTPEDGGGERESDEPSPGGGVGAGGEKVCFTEEVYNCDVGKAVERALGRADLTRPSHREYRPYSTANDKVHTRHDKRGKYSDLYTYGLQMNEPEAYERAARKTAGVVSVIRRKLERAVMAKERRDWDFGRDHGHIDSRRLVGAYDCRENIFKLRGDRPEIDTAVSVLIDLSGSMVSKRVHTAREAAIALAQAMEKTRISYEVLGFNARSGPNGPCDYSRIEPIDLYVFKDFRERLFDAKGAIGSIVAHAGGNNVDGESILLAYDRLKKRPEKRKVLLVMSDGYPAFKTNTPACQSGHLLSVVERLQGQDVDLVGIGIKSDAVETFYPRHVVLWNIDDLAGECMDQLGKILLGDRFSARR